MKYLLTELYRLPGLRDNTLKARYSSPGSAGTLVGLVCEDTKEVAYELESARKSNLNHPDPIERTYDTVSFQEHNVVAALEFSSGIAIFRLGELRFAVVTELAD